MVTVSVETSTGRSAVLTIGSLSYRVEFVIGIDQKVDAQDGLVGGIDNLDEVDARHPFDGLFEQCGQPIFAWHQSVTSRFRNRRSCFARMV